VPSVPNADPGREDLGAQRVLLPPMPELKGSDDWSWQWSERLPAVPSGLQQRLPAAGERPETYVALHRRHPDGHRWVEVARFPTRADADVALASVLEGGHANADELRVFRVNIARP